MTPVARPIPGQAGFPFSDAEMERCSARLSGFRRPDRPEDALVAFEALSLIRAAAGDGFSEEHLDYLLKAAAEFRDDGGERVYRVDAPSAFFRTQLRNWPGLKQCMMLLTGFKRGGKPSGLEVGAARRWVLRAEGIVPNDVRALTLIAERRNITDPPAFFVSKLKAWGCDQVRRDVADANRPRPS